MSLENRKKRKEKKSYCCDSYTSLDYVLRNSLAPTVEDLIGVLYEVAVKNHRLVAMKKTFKKFLESIRGSDCDYKCDICERVHILKSSNFKGFDVIECFYCKFIYWNCRV